MYIMYSVQCTERFIYYRKSVLHLLKSMFHVHLSNAIQICGNIRSTLYNVHCLGASKDPLAVKKHRHRIRHHDTLILLEPALGTPVSVSGRTLVIGQYHNTVPFGSITSRDALDSMLGPP